MQRLTPGTSEVGIEQLDVLNFVSLRNNDSETVLTIADSRDWSDTADGH